MTRKYFGTDGVRGLVGEAPITPDFVMKLGFAAGQVLVDHGSQPTVLIGKDTRISGYMLEAALEAGLTAAGVHVLLTGPIPTPAVAYLTRTLRLSAGVMISASHNPYHDNGIKFFARDGRKLPDSVELEIEAALDGQMKTRPSLELGRARRIDAAQERYIEFCKSTFPNDLSLQGLRLVVDCAHGATYHIAPRVLHELGAEVIEIGVEPNGFNINDGFGATAPRALQQAVLEYRADLGLAFDGDGDRLMMVDSTGRLFDGDQLLYVIARARHAQGRLKGGVVGTLMTNLGMEQALNERGIEFARAKVGDRYVLEQLEARQWQLGGEASGHILCLDRHSTGDGVISALQVLTALLQLNTSLSALSDEWQPFPQTLINVKISGGQNWQAQCEPTLAQANAALAGRGRVVLRPSGTEPVVRVMVEANEAVLANHWANALADAIKAEV